MERVVAELRRLHAEGEIVNRAALLEAGYSTLVSAVERYCGSFKRAVRLAGFAYVPARPVWTPASVREELRKLHRDGIALNCEQLIRDGKSGIVTAAKKHFGSWRAAVAKAGLPAFKRGRFPTWAAVRTQLGALHDSGMKMSTSTLTARGFADLVEAAKKLAGTWNAALEKARIPLVMRYGRWTREDVLAGIRRRHASGAGLGANVAIADGERKLVKAATRIFKTWRIACSVAVPTYRQPMVLWSVSRVIREIKKRHRAGKSVRSTDVQKDQPTLYDAARRYGLPWREACRRADIPVSARQPRPSPKKRRRWTEAAILAEFKAAAAAERPLLVRSFPPALVQAVHRHWGSWGDAMAAAGLARRYRRDRTAAAAKRLGGNFVRRRRG